MKKVLMLVVMLIALENLSYAQKVQTKSNEMKPLINVPVPEGYTLLSYDLSFLEKGEDIKGPFHVVNDKFPGDAMQAMARIRPGAKVYYENIKIKDNKTGQVTSMKGFSDMLK